jgi:hypothetical protein
VKSPLFSLPLLVLVLLLPLLLLRDSGGEAGRDRGE